MIKQTSINSIFLFFIKLIISLSYVNFVKLEQEDGFYFPSRIVNEHNFDYILNPLNSICKTNSKDDKVFLLIYVHTAPDHFKRRVSIRETWAQRSLFTDTRIVFMMGTTDDLRVNEKVKLEYGVYQDIIQEDFHDSYKNLTYKGIMALKWTSKYCKNANYILKIDDDILVNPFVLYKHLKTMDRLARPKNSIICHKFTHMKVQRSPKNKWFVSKDEYKGNYFSKYCSGSAFILTNDLPKKMYVSSLHMKFFWVDDFYITGLLIRASKGDYIKLNSAYIISSRFVETRFLGRQTDLTIFGHLGVLYNPLNKAYSIWRFLISRRVSLYDHEFAIYSDAQQSSVLYNYLPSLEWEMNVFIK